jgi:hypothetical protein
MSCVVIAVLVLAVLAWTEATKATEEANLARSHAAAAQSVAEAANKEAAVANTRALRALETIPPVITRQSEQAFGAIRELRDALNDLASLHQKLRSTVAALTQSAASAEEVKELRTRDLRELRTRLDVTENAMRQSRARIAEVIEKLERAAARGH